MKNPNGYGAVFKQTGKRRKPYTARVTTDWIMDETTGKLRQQYKYLGYYETYEEAMIALADYHRNPNTVELSVTFEEIYNRWSRDKYPTISDSNVKAYRASYKCCEPLYQMQFNQIRLDALQSCVDNSGKNYPTLRKLKVLLNQMYEYAMQHDICEKDYSQYVNIAKHKDQTAEDIHKPFTTAEREVLWNSAERSQDIQIILILIYSGVRIGELLDLKKADVHLSERYFDIKQSKTKAGIRKVPIAEKVYRYWETLMQTPGESFITNSKGTKNDYRVYKESHFEKSLEQLGLPDHLPHDTRHTCVSMLAEAQVPKHIIQRIVGHQGADVTDNVYTHYEIQQLIDAINRI